MGRPATRRQAGGPRPNPTLRERRNHSWDDDLGSRLIPMLPSAATAFVFPLRSPPCSGGCEVPESCDSSGNSPIFIPAGGIEFGKV